MGAIESNGITSRGETAFWRRVEFLVPALVVVAVVAYLFFIRGYATGYGHSRSSLWTEMRLGYQRDNGEWGFGWFVPLAVVVIGWVSRDRYRDLRARPGHWLGALVLLFAFFLYFVGYKANQKYIGFMSGQILAAGAVLWFLGPAWFRKGLWLWILLGMVWPWRFLIEPISTPLQLLMVRVTSTVLHWIGDPATTSGTAIHSTKLDPITGERLNLNVAAACSGLRSLFALAMIAMAYGYISLTTSWKRLLLLLSVPVLAVIGNAVRMLMLYFGAQWKGSEWAIGEGEFDPSGYHIGAGLVVFVVALAGMAVLVDLLRYGPRFFRRKRALVRTVESGREVTE